MLRGGFAQPVWEGELGVASRGAQDGHDAVVVLATDEDVEILGVALDAGVVKQRVRAANQERSVAVLQCGQDLEVERQDRRFRHTDCSDPPARIMIWTGSKQCAWRQLAIFMSRKPPRGSCSRCWLASMTTRMCCCCVAT